MQVRKVTTFDIINIGFLVFITLLIIYPLYFTIIASFSDPYQVMRGEVLFFPKGLNLNAYKNILKNDEIWTGYLNTFFYTVSGTLYAIAVTVPCAYALSKKGLKGRNIIMGIFVFTMYFGGGLIPYYLLIKSLGLIDTAAVMVVPSAMSVFNMIVTRTFFQTNLSDELYEAAKIDGCSEFGIFLRIALPLSGAIIAVIALFYAVGQWNSFFSALLFLDNRRLYPLQLVLRNILIRNQSMKIDITSMRAEELQAQIKEAFMAETMKYSLIFISSLPVLVAYPFVQKYFVKGVMIGAIKG